MKTHYTIPIFIPEKACPFKCVYCNQFNITNRTDAVNVNDIKSIVDMYLATIPQNAIVRIGFFGGSFTCMPVEEQSAYLSAVQEYVNRRVVSEIQLSTRPDFINDEILSNLKNNHVTIIELGAQSLSDDVLKLCGRGHTADDVENASRLINSYGFDLGLQMMLGLPGDSFETSFMTAKKIVEFGAKYTRIYPTLVIKNSYLEKMYYEGVYKPLSLYEAVSWCKNLVAFFNENNVNILRVGLHPSEGLLSGESLVTGPFHVSFKELVLTELWHDKINSIVEGKTYSDEVTIFAPETEMNYAVGYGGKNKKYFSSLFPKLKFKITP